jgi:20S proteasome alpha/beta subunit
MTIVVGIKCKDGVVLGSDSSATFGVHPQMRTIEQRAKKTFIIGDNIIFSGTGQIGLGQRFGEIVERLSKKMAFESSRPIEVMTTICRETINDFFSTKVDKGCYGALLAFVADHDFQLCEFSLVDFQPELKTNDIWFAAIGSGQLIADPFLGLIKKVFFKADRPRLNEGIFAVTWVLQHAIDVNPGGINGPPQIGVLAKHSGHKITAKLLSDDELNEHIANAEGAEAHLATYRDILSGKQKTTTTPPPSPPAPPTKK